MKPTKRIFKDTSAELIEILVTFLLPLVNSASIYTENLPLILMVSSLYYSSVSPK